jgi:OmpA-OmpF porin, OOP family
MNNRVKFSFCSLLLSLLFSGILCSAADPKIDFELRKDAPGSQDHPLTGRYADSVILAQKHKDYDEYSLALGRTVGRSYQNNLHFDKTQALEGTVTRTVYLVPSGRSTLEVLRNFEQHFEASGLHPLFVCATHQCVENPDSLDDFSKLLYSAEPITSEAYSQIRNYLAKAALERVTAIRYKTWSLHRPQGDIYAAVYVGEQTGGTMGNYSEALKGSVVALVDVIEQKVMEHRMVTLSADQLQKDLAADGKVALYGILFDNNKAEVKPESQPQLEEMAKYLHSHPSVGVYVVGHTDDQGTLTYNLELSERRAQAIVQALTTNYKIDGRRLMGRGVGPLVPVAPNTSEENRAKNRRVELVERHGQ